MFEGPEKQNYFLLLVVVFVVVLTHNTGLEFREQVDRYAARGKLWLNRAV